MPIIYNKRRFCPMRHENGNCLPAGGFCTAVNDPICEALHNAFRHGESAEYERLTLAVVQENAKNEKEKLEALREILKKVTSTTVEVVRCKDCIYYEIGKDYEPYCNHVIHGIPYPKADDFCSYGERNDNNVHGND